MNVAWPHAAPDREPDLARAVERFLRANPDWLAANPDLYRCLTPPARVHGEAMADHMEAMVQRERRHAASMTEQAEAVLAAGRAATAAQARVHEAVLALMIAPDVAECLAGDVARLLELDAVCLCRRGGTDAADRLAGPLEARLGRRDVLFRDAPEDAATLYAEAAPLAARDILVRLPGVGVLALASRAEMAPLAGVAGPALQFLGRAVAARLGGG